MVGIVDSTVVGTVVGEEVDVMVGLEDSTVVDTVIGYHDIYLITTVPYYTLKHILT
jgi:hypothetical protein